VFSVIQITELLRACEGSLPVEVRYAKTFFGVHLN